MRPCTLALLALMLAPPLATAEDMVSFGASARGRYEVRRDFKFGAIAPGNNDDYFLTQVRLNALIKPSESFQAFLEAQHAGILDEEGVNDDDPPNAFADDFDLHQAYLTAKWSDLSVQAKVGRQKLKYGSERLVGPLEWSNTARVFDAAVVTVGDAATRAVDLFASRVVPADPHRFNDWSGTGNRYGDSELYGAYGSDRSLLGGSAFEPYYLLRRSEDLNDLVHSLGLRVEKKFERFTLDGEGTYQWGEFAGNGHEAFALHGGARYRLVPDEETWAIISYNYASGDRDPLDDNHGTFDNLFPTNHGFYGYMDLVSLQNIHNLEVAFSTVPACEIELRVAWHEFWLAQKDSDAWYNAGGAPIRPAAGDYVDAHLGSELDVTLIRSFFEKKLTVLAGYSHFFTGGYIADTGSSSDADFIYLQGRVAL